VLRETAVARLEDGGGGVGIVRLVSKMGVIGPETFDILDAALDAAGGQFRALVIAGDSRRAFSAGVDLKHFISLMDRPGALDSFLRRGQETYLALRQAPVPVVAALRGLALGGGCELMLHCDAAVAHLETRIGLPEATLGILPGWGGCTRMLERCGAHGTVGAAEAAARAFEILRAGVVAANAREAQGIGYLDGDAGIVMHPDDVEAAAVEKARALVPGYLAPEDGPIPLAGAAETASLVARVVPDTGEQRAWQETVARDLAEVLTGGADGDPSRTARAAEFHALERAAVLRMVGRPQTRAAIDRIVA
jgi:3-hydroxyacyl-CoA dehydrogenase